MPQDTEYQLRQKIEGLQTEVRSLSNLLYEACEQLLRSYHENGIPHGPSGRVFVWWRANNERLIAQREEESRMEAAARLRKEQEYERLRRELGKEN